MFVALFTDQRKEAPWPLSMLDGSALKKLIAGFST
jgi:hypothetical protein